MTATITTTDGIKGTRVGNKLVLEDGNEYTILVENLPPLRQGGRIIQRSYLVEDSKGRQKFLFYLPTDM